MKKLELVLEKKRNVEVVYSADELEDLLTANIVYAINCNEDIGTLYVEDCDEDGTAIFTVRGAEHFNENIQYDELLEQYRFVIQNHDEIHNVLEE